MLEKDVSTNYSEYGVKKIGVDVVNSNLKILGTFESGIKFDVAEKFVQEFSKKYCDVEGELYL